MSLEAMLWALKHPLLEDEGTKLLLVVIGNHAPPHGCCYPGHELLAETCPCSTKTVQRRLKSLEDLGLVVRVPRFRQNGSRTSDWIVLGPWDVRGGHMQMTWPGEEDVPEKVRKLIIPPTDNLTSGQPEPQPTDTGVQTRTLQGNQSSLLPPSGERDAPAKAKTVSYRGQRVPKDMVAAAERLVAEFNGAAQRNLSARTSAGTASEHLKQVIGAMMSHPEASEGQWVAAVRNVVANPPDWLDGALQIGHVFGPKAASHALSNTGQPKPQRNGNAAYDEDVQRRMRIAEGQHRELPS